MSGPLAQLAEQLTLNQQVTGSIPVRLTNPRTNRLASTSADFLFEEFVRSRRQGMSPQSIRFYRICLKPFLGKYSLTSQGINAFLSSRKCNNGRHAYYRAIRAFCNWAVKEGHLTENPLVKVDVPKIKKRILPSLMPEQVEYLIEQAETLRDKAMVSLFADSGMRLSELASIRAPQIDWEHSLVTIWGKGGKQRKAPFTERTAEMLREYVCDNGTGDNIWHLNTWGVISVLRRLEQKTGLPCNPHTFRRTFASNFHRRGLDIEHIMRLDKDLFRQVQKVLSKNAPRAVHPRIVPSFYLLSGILVCTCGSAMVGRSAKSHQYYTCNRNFREGKDACNSGLIPKDKIESAVLEQLKEVILMESNVKELVKLVNEDIKQEFTQYQDRIDSVDTQLKEINTRLGRLYDAIETGKVSLDELAPRIRELKSQKDSLDESRIQAEADAILQHSHVLAMSAVKEYIADLKDLLEQADNAERKTFLRSFVKMVIVDHDRATIEYKLPIPPTNEKKKILVLPIDTTSGLSDPIAQPKIETFFELSLIPSHQ